MVRFWRWLRGRCTRRYSRQWCVLPNDGHVFHTNDPWGARHHYIWTEEDDGVRV